MVISKKRSQDLNGCGTRSKNIANSRKMFEVGHPSRNENNF